MSDPTERGGRSRNLSVIMGERRQLINVAYRLLGTLADSEDMVQETYARWYALSQQERDAIDSPGAWMSRVMSRLCLNALSSARARRERFVGEWMPEPLPEPTEWVSGRSGSTAIDPADRVTLDESVSMAYLVVLDSMTPAERVTFILHDIFRYPFAEVSEIVGRSAVACRQLASSARRRIRASDALTMTPTGQQARVIKGVKHACDVGDMGMLVGLLDPEATMAADGGGLAKTALHPIRGAERIARYALGVMGEPDDTTVLERTVNGLPGLVLQREGVTVTVAAFQIEGDRITRIWVIRNPEKLRQWTENHQDEW
ncbi:RNA polymerase sigma factor SigJ [Paramicrobacterium fandaimingii]|uniref:RNA polymerase sigma factor SigJ n=1 Tax=Paramicrobacterium fandaimingii TaxID=2708079 RepID=UPI0014231155|nr:RNA polymerase sigma factor SigJ [Microbacterium fandaimingii]